MFDNLSAFLANPYMGMLFYFFTIRLLRTGIASVVLILIILSVRAICKKYGHHLIPGLPQTQTLYRLWTLLLLAPFCGRLRAVESFLTPVEPTAYLIGNVSYTGPLFQLASCLPFCVFCLSLTLFLFLIDRLKSRRFKRKVLTYAIFQDNHSVLAGAAAKVGLRTGKIRCRISENANPPFSFGLIHPFIVLPCDYATRYGRADLDAVFVHELIHIRRGDLWVLALLRLMRCAWWFNPLLPLICPMISREMELTCDETALSLGEDPYTYGMALIHSLSCSGGTKEREFEFNPRVTELCGERNHLRKRIFRIYNWTENEQGKYFYGSRWAARILITCALAVSLLVILFFSYPPFTDVNRIVDVTDITSGRILMSGEEIKDCLSFDKNGIWIDNSRFCENLQNIGWNGEDVQINLILYQKEQTHINTGCILALDLLEDDGETFYLSFYGEEGIFSAIYYLLFKYI